MMSLSIVERVNCLVQGMQNYRFHQCSCLIELQKLMMTRVPLMPGCLGLDAMWQLVGFYLGWIGNPGKGRALGVGTVKFTGEVLQDVKLVKYEIDMKKIMSPGGTTVGLANGVVLADEKKIYSADNLKVGLFK